MGGRGFLALSGKPNRQWLRDYVISEDYPRVVAEIEEAIANKAIFQMEHQVVRFDGSIGWAFSRAVPLIDDRGEITEWFGATTDITTRVRAEAALRESEKLAVVGRLATSIAHEINNPLEAVTNLVYLAQTSAADAETKQYLDMAQSELTRVGHIASETLRFHRQSTHPSASNLGEVVDSVVSLHEGRLRGAQVSVHRRYRPHPPLVCYPNEIRQVVANLVGNALDAMLERTKRDLYLRVREAHDPSTGVAGVRVTIADTGSGMNRATQQRIFEPFFTTKEATGTGLGLWVSQEIVRKHGGTLSVRSRREQDFAGTVFAVFLPRDDELTAGIS
jgi:signal transduction histidine kinase